VFSEYNEIGEGVYEGEIIHKNTDGTYNVMYQIDGGMQYHILPQNLFFDWEMK